MRKNAFQLNEEEIKLLESERLRARQGKEFKYDRRLRGILLCGRDGLSQRKAAEMIEMKLRYFQIVIRKYREEGIGGVKVQSPPGRTRTMSEEQERELSNLLESGPSGCGYDTGVWDWRTVRDLIFRQFNLKYSKSHIHRILHKLGFTVQYPNRNLYGADQELQQRWVKETFSEVKKKADEEGAIIYYEDEAVFQQSGTIHRTWAPRGKGTVVDSKPCRRSVKSYGAISLENKPRWHFRFSERFNAKSFVAYLSQILRWNPVRKIYLILDNARYHHAVMVREFLELHDNRLILIFLPPYSPNLNIVERVWKLTKKLATHNRFFDELKELKRTIFRRFNRYQGNPASLRSLVENHI